LRTVVVYLRDHNPGSILNGFIGTLSITNYITLNRRHLYKYFFHNKATKDKITIRVRKMHCRITRTLVS